MNAGSFGPDGSGSSSHHAAVAGAASYGGRYSHVHDPAVYQQQQQQQQHRNLGTSSDSSLKGASLGQSQSQLTNSMGNLNVDSNHVGAGINSSSSSSSTSKSKLTENNKPSASRHNNNNLPVKYRISWNKYSNAFTITLIVPKHGQDGTTRALKPKSPFQLVNDSTTSLTNPTNNGQETHALRIPLPYLVKLSKQSSSSSHQPTTATWLDRSTLRARLTDGGKAVGLDPSQIFQSIAAVEESATRIAEWAPASTESVDVNVLLSDGIVSLVAKVTTSSSSSRSSSNKSEFIYQQAQGQGQTPQARSAAAPDPSTLHFNYNVLNESSGSSLLATAPSFSTSTGDLSLLSNNDAQLHASPDDNLSNNNNSSVSSGGSGSGRVFSSFPPPSSSNKDGIFGSPKGSLSSYDPWSKPTGTAGSRMGFAQEQNRNQHQNAGAGAGAGVDQNMPHDTATAHGSLPTLNLVSSDHPVNANQLFSAQHNGLNASTDRSKRDSNENPAATSSTRQRKNTRPDPSIILEPLMSMGFTRAECEAAILAIRNLANHDDLPLPPGQDHLSRQRSLSASSVNSGHTGRVQQQEHNFPETQTNTNTNTLQHRNVSGEDILGYVLNNGSNASAFEQSMAEAVAADNFQSTHQSQKPNRDFRSNGSSHSQDSDKSWNSDSPEQMMSSSNGPVWGNAGKLKVVKSSSGNGLSGGGAVTGTVSGTDYSDQTDSVRAGENSSATEASWNTSAGAQTQKMVKVLDIPPELNAFVFHCNAQTREECLERGLFGCPSGGQYGPHSKAKKGDLLFLADFSAWTVSGIFTAKTDAGLNIDKVAWNGRFPWQIRVDTWTDLRTVHIDKVNEIIGLASGSKLNMLTKEQLTQLVTSKEFGPCVPPHLFKIKSVPQSSTSGPQMTEKAKYSEFQGPRDSLAQAADVEANSKLGIHRIKYNRAPSTPSTNDEHPATAMHRLKLVTSWFDSLASEVLTMNEVFNRKRSSPKKDSQKDNKILLDDRVLSTIKSCSGHSWPLMNYSYVRRAVADIFDQWLLLAHAISGKKDKTGSENIDKSDSSSWTRQQSRSISSNGKIKEDVVLLQRVPGAASHVQRFFQAISGTSAMSVPNKIAELLATKFINEIEQISSEVRKTQLSLMKIGGENYMQSIEDKALGMKISEGVSKQAGPNQESNERSIVRIEWHTKSSIAQGRPPQVQKVFKTHFDVLEKSYRNQVTSEDPQMSHFLTRLFVLLCRYDLIGDVTHRCQTIIPPMAQEAISSQFGVGHDCFASPLCAGRSSFNSSLFADSCKFFGSLGSFFDFVPIEGSFLANPPFIGGTLKPMFDHVFRLLQHSDNEKSALSFLIAIRESDPILNNVKRSHFCRRILALENSPKYAVNTLYKDTCSASRKQPKNNMDNGSLLDCSGAWSSSSSPILIWLQNDFGHDVWTPSDEKVGDIVHGFRAQRSNSAILA